jgi:hypothetical protein
MGLVQFSLFFKQALLASTRVSVGRADVPIRWAGGKSDRLAGFYGTCK